MFLHDLFDPELLIKMRNEGYVREQTHPTLSALKILNYTEKTTFSRQWNDVTRQCRGLIYNTYSFEVLARPFPKFFNYGEDQTGPSFETYRESPVTVTDKMDGSLGILYYTTNGGHAIATRGSFNSPQAIHATARLQDYIISGSDRWWPEHGVTYLFEIIYPGNRIVCDYGNMDELVLLGTVNIDHGYSTPPVDASWPGPTAKIFPYKTFQQAMEAEPRDGAEGLVVHFIERDMRLKLKQADYVALHRIVTGMNERAVWLLLKDGKTTEEICEPLPEEFWPWVETVSANLQAEWFGIWDAVDEVYSKTMNSLPEGWTRRDFAAKAVGTTYAPMLFNKLDKKDYGETIWQRIKPAASGGPWQRTEDNA